MLCMNMILFYYHVKYVKAVYGVIMKCKSHCTNVSVVNAPHQSYDHRCVYVRAYVRMCACAGKVCQGAAILQVCGDVLDHVTHVNSVQSCSLQ